MSGVKPLGDLAYFSSTNDGPVVTMQNAASAAPWPSGRQGINYGGSRSGGSERQRPDAVGFEDVQPRRTL